MPDVRGVRNGATGQCRVVMGVMPAGRVTIGRVNTGAIGRPTPAPGERTMGARATGACGARTTPPGLAPPPCAPAAACWANALPGVSASADAKKIPQIVLRLTAMEG